VVLSTERSESRLNFVKACLWVHFEADRFGIGVLDANHITAQGQCGLGAVAVGINHSGLAVHGVVFGAADVALGVNLIDGRFVGAALVYRDFLGDAIGLDGLLENAHRRLLVLLGRLQEVDGLTRLVDCTIKVLPNTVDQNGRRIDAPTRPHEALVFLQRHFQQRPKPNRPAVDQRMIDDSASFMHHFLQLAVAQWVGCVPADPA